LLGINLVVSIVLKTALDWLSEGKTINKMKTSMHLGRSKANELPSRPSSSPGNPVQYLLCPLSPASRANLRRAVVSSFQAAALLDPGGKEAAALRISAPSPSPTPDAAADAGSPTFQWFNGHQLDVSQPRGRRFVGGRPRSLSPGSMRSPLRSLSPLLSMLRTENVTEDSSPTPIESATQASPHRVRI
jgi:hypothetical protein